MLALRSICRAYSCTTEAGGWQWNSPQIWRGDGTGVTTHVLVCQGGRRAYTMLIMNAPTLDYTDWEIGERAANHGIHSL